MHADWQMSGGDFLLGDCNDGLCQLGKTVVVAVVRYVTMLDVILFKSVILCIIMCI